MDETASRFFDIEIVVADENGGQQKIEPKATVSVNIQLDTVTPTAAETADQDQSQVQNPDPTVLHFAESGVEQMQSDTTVDNHNDTPTEIQFEAESFSIYGVVYTVDFRWEVDGNVYEFSLAGGNSVSFRELVDVLGVMDTANSAADNNKKSNSHSTVDEFIDDVEKVEFSDESLVKVARITEGITAGALKEKLEIESEYSAELTEAQIEEINSQVFYAPDWALISLKAFSSEEYLTVTMKTGEVFTIAVTDAQIKKTVIDAKGDTWEVTVTYDDEACIPDGAALEVE